MYSLISQISLAMTLSLAACHDAATSHLKITNSQITTDYPAVVQIHKGCSASFIRPHVLLTAAHCVKPNGGPYALKDLKVASTHVVVHPQYNGSSIVNDVALIFFDRDLAPTILPLQNRLPLVDDLVTTIGYGPNRYLNNTLYDIPEADGQKRVGRNRVSNVTNAKIFTVGTHRASPDEQNPPIGENSALVSGDSGGPLLNEAGEIIGIATAVTMGGDLGVSGTKIVSMYTSMASVDDFLQENLGSKGIKPEFVDTCEKNIRSEVMQILLKNYAPDGSCMSLLTQLAVEPFVTLVTRSPGSQLDLALLSQLHWLNGLSISGFKILNFDKIREFKDLSALEIKFSGVRDFSDLTHLWSLQKVLILEHDAVDVTHLRVIPNISDLTVNNAKVSDLSPIQGSFFRGKWAKECDHFFQGSFVNSTETLEYDASTRQLKFVAKLYGDKECKGPILKELRRNPEVLWLKPQEKPDFYTVALKGILFWQDPNKDEDRSNLFKFSPLTTFRKSDNLLWFSERDMQYVSWNLKPFRPVGN